MSDLKQFTRSKNGKIRQLGCPYEGLGPVVELTATEYVQGDRCLCSYCWANAPLWRWAQCVEWEDNDAS